MLALTPLAILSLVLPIAALPSAKLEVVENLRSIPQNWVRGSAVPPSKPLHFRIAIQQEEKNAEFEQKVIDLSTPGHESYGKHMTREEVQDFLRPAPKVSDAILSWLDSEGVPKEAIENKGNWVNFAVPAEKAEKMLDAEFFSYENTVNEVSRIRTLSYSVPEEIRPYIQMIQPTTRFGDVSAQRSFVFDVIPNEGGSFRASADEVDCNQVVTPDCLRELYSMQDAQAKPHPKNKLGISGYLEQYARFADWEQWIDTYAPELEGVSFEVESIAGGLNLQNSSADSVEASLDIDYAIGMSQSTAAVFYTTAGRGPLIPDLDQPDAAEGSNEPYLDQLQYLLDLDDEDLPSVLSTSYGENEQSVPETYSESTCNLIAQLGARGVSVIFSSGDTGVGSACQTNDGFNTTRFLPIFPAACPFVTSVGGTTHIEPEEAIYFSSGGFSDRHRRPPYQDEAVKAYLEQLGDRWDGLYNPEGRGFPDVSAQAYNYSVIDHGSPILVGGTSASAPFFAAVVAQLNSLRLEAGKPTLGFLNPLIYKFGLTSGFTDIVDGGSTGCTGEDQYSGLPTPFVPYASWNATKGWDPVTGLGTPIFPQLSEMVLKDY
ncbi:vesicle formation at the endoplasmic reticulum [Arachnomyces sp. PD_36]|nr:vesicle formation at the endoplasmic reticulum [Arachnomyces sp. PD_36]